MTASRDIVNSASEISKDEHRNPLDTFPSKIWLNRANQPLSPADAAEIGRKLQQLSSQFGFFKFDAAFKKRAAELLAEAYIQDANVDKAKLLIQLEPEILLLPIPRITLFRHHQKQTYINYTPFQVAYAEGNGAMCAMMEPFFALACGSDAAAQVEMQKQINEKFSEEPAQQEKRKAAIKKLLAPLIEAITNEQFDHDKDENEKVILSEPTLAAINTFREDFAASQPTEIEQGVRFDIDILQAFMDVYVKAEEDWEYSYGHYALLEDAAMSLLLQYVPSYDAQHFSRGLFAYQHDQEKFKDTTIMRCGADFFDALCKDSLDFRLSGSNVDIIYGRAQESRNVSSTDIKQHLDAYCEARAAALQSLCNPQPQPTIKP